MARALPRHTRRGFTMIEVLAAVALLGVGIVAALSAIGGMTRSEASLRESERMQRLADEKLQELVGTGDYQFLTEGDFQDRNETRYDWTAAIEPTGTENLEVLTVTVTRADRRDDEGYTASEAIFIPPTLGGGAP